MQNAASFAEQRPRVTTVNGLLKFAALSQLPDGFGYLLTDGSIDVERGLETWINARMTHCFSLAVLLGRRDCAPLATHGIAALDDVLRDSMNRGWLADTTGRHEKSAYEHAFVMLAASTASIAELPGAVDLLDEVLAIWDEYFWDEDDGAARDRWNADWTSCDGYRGANSNMHGVEAMLAVAAALPERADDMHARCLRVLDRIVHCEAKQRGWRLPEHYDSSWRAQLEYNRDQPIDPFRPYGVTVGHQFEWARLALHTRAAIGADAPSWLLDDAKELYAAADTRGWSEAGIGGFVYTLDWDDLPVSAQHFHWVLAEAISAAGVFSRVTGDGRYLADLRNWQDLSARYFLDETTGNWHHELGPDGSVANDTWAGQPDIYHVLQSLLLPRHSVSGSIAESICSTAQVQGGKRSGVDDDLDRRS